MSGTLLRLCHSVLRQHSGRRLFCHTGALQQRGQSAGSELIQLLLRNPELDEHDARRELGWIRDEIRSPRRDESSGSPLRDLVARRAAGEPLQYVLGSTDFGPLTIRVRTPTLIPRPETADLTQRLALLVLSIPDDDTGALREPLRILDICTGSGCIPLLLRHELGQRAGKIIGVDLSSAAVQLARENAEITGLDVQFMQADLFDPDSMAKVTDELGGKPHIVISNPPYIPLEQWKQLPVSVKEWEDPRALVGQEGFDAAQSHSTRNHEDEQDGLAFYRRIADLLPDLLEPMPDDKAGVSDQHVPRLVVEHGEGQASAVREILLKSALSVKRADIWQDRYGVDRGVAVFLG